MDPSPTVRQLRSRWKPIKQRLLEEKKDHPTTIRFHRACSWLGRVEELDHERDLDLALLLRWIAFNALYGRWDEQNRQPQPDLHCWRQFLERILALDQAGSLPQVLQEHKRLVMAILDDAYLSGFFWEDPTPKRAGQSRKAKYEAQTWYIERRWALVLDRLVERIYLMRCQLTHGAATFGGRLNRTSLRRCSTMLGHLLPAMLQVLIDHGSEEYWGPMCYPPLG